MENQTNALPAEGAAKPAQKPALTPAALAAPKIYTITPRDRNFLRFTALFCIFLSHAFLNTWFNPSAGLTASVYAWYGLLLAWRGASFLESRSSQVLLVVNLLLASALALGSNEYFRWWNFLFLLVLIPVHALSGCGKLPWHRPAMLWERLRLLMSGLFGNLGAAPAALRREKGNSKRTAAIALGLSGALALVCVLLPVLASADALFAAATRDLRLWGQVHLVWGFWQIFWGLVLTPFCFGLLYAINHPAPVKENKEDSGQKPIDPLVFLLILGALDLLYLLFLAVQSAGLFGGPAYLEQRGISYAEWARSGFFQMSGVTVLNLTVLLAALTFSRKDAALWRHLRLLAGGLVAESFILLASACWRMTLYTSAYGLSFKRCMTYWGMGIMALLLLAALRKVLRPDFGFCRWAFPLILAGWLAVNCVPIDFLVARNQVNRSLAGEPLDAGYLLYGLSYDALSQLERLDGEMVLELGGRTTHLSSLIKERQAEARRACSDWRTWSLSACLALR